MRRCSASRPAAGATTTRAQTTTLVVYSGREEELVEPLFERFEEETGIDVEVRYGDSAELAATIAEEGDNSPADVFFAQDPGSLGAVEREGRLAELPQAALDRVPARFRDPDGHWVGTSGRSRVIAYNTDALVGGRGSGLRLRRSPTRSGRARSASPPTNASFQAFVSAMLLELGEERTREWLEGLKANEPKLYEKNTPVVEAVGSGEIELGLVNHYYLYLVKEENPDAAGREPLPARARIPARSSSSPAPAILETRRPRGRSASGSSSSCSPTPSQRFYVDEAEEAEYPLVAGHRRQGRPPAARQLWAGRRSSSTSSAPSSSRRSSC